MEILLIALIILHYFSHKYTLNTQNSAIFSNCFLKLIKHPKETICYNS